MKNYCPHLPGILVWPILIAWCMSWAGIIVASLWFLVTVVKLSIWVLS